MKTDHGLWRVTLDGKTYVLEVGHGWVDLRPGREKGCKEASVRMKALAAQIHGLRGTARVNVKNFSYFVSPIRAQTLTFCGKPDRCPAFCGGCGEDGPGCPACERTEAGRLRYDAMEILGVVVRRLELTSQDFRIEDWTKTLLLARVTVAFRSKDSSPVDKECLLIEWKKGKRVYLPAHPSWHTEGMPRWRKQISLFDDAPEAAPPRPAVAPSPAPAAPSSSPDPSDQMRLF